MDIYVSNAARHLHKTFFETTNEDWHCFLSQQLTETFVPGMIAARWGRIIHINSPDGYTYYISRRHFLVVSLSIRDGQIGNDGHNM